MTHILKKSLLVGLVVIVLCCSGLGCSMFRKSEGSAASGMSGASTVPPSETSWGDNTRDNLLYGANN